MTPEALARVREAIDKYLACRRGMQTTGGQNIRAQQETMNELRAALAALTPGPVSVHGFAVSTNTPAPAQGECSCEPPYHHPACTVNNRRNATPPPPEPEGELVRVLVALSRGQNGQCWDRYGCRVNVHDDLCLLAQAALARARGQ